MDVDLSRHLMSPQTHASISAEAMELMGREAATKYIENGIPLNESIAKLAGQHQDFNAEQVKRVVEAANTSVYLSMHDKNKTAGAGSSYPQFELADAGRIIQNLSSGAKPTVITSTDLDYASLPTRKDKVSSASSDAVIDDMFKVAHQDVGYTKDSVLNDVMTAKHNLEDTRASLCHSCETLDIMHKEASESYYQHVKAHLLDEGSFSDILMTARSTGLDSEKVAFTLKPVIVRLLTEKIATVESLKTANDGIDKVAHRVVNTDHPLVTSLAAVATLGSEIEKIASGLDEVDTQLSRLESFIKETFYAGRSR